MGDGKRVRGVFFIAPFVIFSLISAIVLSFFLSTNVITGFVVADYDIPRENAVILYLPMNGDAGGMSYGEVDCSFPGKFGSGCQFQGDNDYIQINDLISGKKELSISIWLKAGVSNANRNYVAFEQDGMGKDPVKLERLADERYRFSLLTTRRENIDSEKKFPDTSWHHVVAVYDGLKMKLYVDGVLEGSKSQSWNVASALFRNRPNIGSDGTDSWDGTIDEVIIWDKGLKENEVIDLFNSEIESHDE